MENFPGFTRLQILAEIQNMMTEYIVNLQFAGRITFMSMYHERKQIILYFEFQDRTRICKNIRARALVDLGLDQKRNGTELILTSRVENGFASLRT